MQLKLRRFWIQLTSDRKRFGLLCAMLALGMLLWARIIIVRNVPRTVVADDPGSTTAAETENSSGDTKNGASSLAGFSGSPIAVELDARPARDPFVISTEFFPKHTAHPDLEQDQGKSRGQRVEDSESTKSRWLALLQEQVKRLRLEAVMSSPPMASLNGRMYRLGDEIAADPQDTIRFTLTEVRERSVIVEYEGRSFEVKLPSFSGTRDR